MKAKVGKIVQASFALCLFVFWPAVGHTQQCEDVCEQTQQYCVRQSSGCAQSVRQCAQEKLECAQNKNVCVQKNTRTGACTQYQQQCARYERRCAQYRDVCVKQNSGCAQYDKRCVRKKRVCKQPVVTHKTPVTQKPAKRATRQTCSQCMSKLNACFARCDTLNDLIMQNRCVNNCNRSTCVSGVDCD